MPFSFRRTRSLGRGRSVTVSSSGVSASVRKGPVSISSRGRLSIRLGKGFSFRTRLW